MIEVGIALLAASGAYALRYVIGRISFWRARRKYIEQEREYIEQLEKMDAAYHPEKPDVVVALKCREYLAEMFPYGIKERTQSLSKEELLALFHQVEKDAEKIMDVEVGTVDFYVTDEPPACTSFGLYNHEGNSLRINAAFILSGNPVLVEEQIYTLFHELKHARQWAAVEGKHRGTKDYGYSDEQIRVWSENFDHYIPFLVSDEWYRKQPVEHDAFGFETILKGERQFEVVWKKL